MIKTYLFKQLCLQFIFFDPPNFILKFQLFLINRYFIFTIIVVFNVQILNENLIYLLYVYSYSFFESFLYNYLGHFIHKKNKIFHLHYKHDYQHYHLWLFINMTYKHLIVFFNTKLFINFKNKINYKITQNLIWPSFLRSYQNLLQFLLWKKTQPHLKFINYFYMW